MASHMFLKNRPVIGRPLLLILREYNKSAVSGQVEVAGRRLSSSQAFLACFLQAPYFSEG